MKKKLLIALLIFTSVNNLFSQSDYVDLIGNSEDQFSLIPPAQSYQPGLHAALFSTGNKPDIGYIIWGIQYGECIHNCSKMYQYKMIKDSNSLFVEIDPTNTYFNNYGKAKYWSRIIDQGKLVLAADIVKHIPYQLLTTTKATDRFGCPDCKDGGAIYFELSINDEIKTFYIDTDASKLSDDIKAFAEVLKTTIDMMEK